jgi:hypothetical protein
MALINWVVILAPYNYMPALLSPLTILGQEIAAQFSILKVEII